MILHVRVVPKAGRELIKEENGTLKVYLTQPAEDGRANAQLKIMLARHFNLKRYQVQIIKGALSRDKVVRLDVN